MRLPWCNAFLQRRNKKTGKPLTEVSGVFYRRRRRVQKRGPVLPLGQIYPLKKGFGVSLIAFFYKLRERV
jgi:hypothetical protein